MSWSKRSFILSALGLAACGFTPVHGPGGSAQGLRGAIEVAAPEDRDTYELVKRLDERLATQTGARYALGYKITVREEGLGVTPEQVIRRVQLRGAVVYTVTDTVTGEVVDTGSVSTFTSYSAEGSTVSTSAVEDDARRRLMSGLADQIATRLMATAADWLA
ncbi:LPS assembly lipoprotein LptE [Aliiroseovarius sp.]|uniref:LPS assembly lipoprotein LptE n=1 Tax=Aliiroseovarius sp. TaxID=1872442 RepID=UPI003BA9C89B